MRRHGFLAIAAASIAACCAWLFSHNHQLDASEEQPGSFREVFGTRGDQTEPVEDSGGIRLNYFEAPWERVLHSVAEQAELTLVMDKVPHGRFARRDRVRYQTESAIRILNAELEAQGFRLIHQGRFLIVLKLDQARTRYARPVMTDWKGDGSANPQNAASNFQQGLSPFHQTGARSDENAPRVAWASQQDRAKPARQQPPTQTFDGAPQPRGNQFGTRLTPVQEEPPAPQPKDEGPPVLKTIAVRNAKAADVARSIYLVFESRAELVREGLHGLPTFVVHASEDDDADTPPLFRIGIDQANSELVLEATKNRVSHLARLVAELDKPKQDDADTVKLIQNKGVTDVTAKELNAQIHRMVAMRSQQAGQPPQGPQGNPPTDSSTSEEGSLNLRGEVNVQAMQDLGILIIKGNEADVEKVEKIVQQLEAMSVGSLPDIHLLSLQFVNSEAMAELLTTVYEQLSELRQRGTDARQTAAFIPIVQPNSILILAPAIELDSILQLADQLDQKTDPNAEFQVFSLRNAIASQVVTAVEAFYDEREGLGTRVRIVADVRTNSVIVQGRQNDLDEISKLVEKIDVDEPGSVHRVQVVQLSHATAEELAETINTAIQSVSTPPQQTGGAGGGFGQANQGAQELRDGKSVALEFLSATGGGRELLRSGILADVRINPDIRSNSLVVSAPEASMPLLLALIESLDREPAAIAEIKVFALENADATQSVELLTAMLENQNQEDQLGVQIAGTEGSSSSLIPVQFVADVRTNTVLAIGGAEALGVVEAILLRLDTTESRKRQTTVIKLQNIQASNVSIAIESYLTQQQGLRDSAEGLVSNIERLRQEVIVAPDDDTNSLIVEASPEYFDQVVQIITELDAKRPQVYIQALMVEVQLDNTDEFGVELGFQDPLLLSRSVFSDLQTITQTSTTAGGNQTTNQTIISANGNPGFNFNNTSVGLGNNLSGLIPGQTNTLNTSPRTVATQGISNFSLGRQNNDLGFGGFVFSAQSDAVSVLVRALAARRTVHVLSRPQILATDNNTASIEVGQEVPVVDGINQTVTSVSPNIVQRNVGIILEVTPRINSDGTISMDVYAEKSALAAGGVPVFTDTTTGNVIESVIIDSAIADTVVTVPNGQTIVIGGMITKNDETLERKVPWLGDLPLIGSAFRYDGTNTRRTELLIFLTPRVVYGEADSELVKQVEAERMHFIESEAEEIHGPLYSVPATEVEYLIPEMMQQQFGQPMPQQMGLPVQQDAGQAIEVNPVMEVPPAQVEVPPQTKVESPVIQPGNSGRRVQLPPTSAATEVRTQSVQQTTGTRSAAPVNSGVVQARSATTEGQETGGEVEKTSWVRRMLKRDKAK